jgi:hypothetical protein
MNKKQGTTMNKTIKTVLTALAVAFLGCGVLCEKTHAVEITGDIGFFGTAVPSSSSLGPPVTITFSNNWQTLSGTGVYAAIPLGTPTTFSNFTFTGDGVSALLSGTVTPEWTFSFGGETFALDLLALTNGHTDPGSMAFSGTGTVHGTGVTAFDDTPAAFALQGSGADFNFTLSSSTTSSVPETGVTTSLLLGFGLLAGCLVRKRTTA